MIANIFVSQIIFIQVFLYLFLINLFQILESLYLDIQVCNKKNIEN